MIPSRYRGIEKTQKEINAVLDSIRAEIETLECPSGSYEWYKGVTECLEIIDKYREVNE